MGVEKLKRSQVNGNETGVKGIWTSQRDTLKGLMVITQCFAGLF